MNLQMLHETEREEYLSLLKRRGFIWRTPDCGRESDTPMATLDGALHCVCDRCVAYRETWAEMRTWRWQLQSGRA